MKRLGVIALVIGVPLAAVASVPLFVRLDGYIPALEKELSTLFSEPVQIRQLRVSLLPTPRLIVNDVAIGVERANTIEALTLKPDLWSLTRRTKTIRSAVAKSVTLSPDALVVLAGLTRRNQTINAPVVVERIQLDDLSLRIGESMLKQLKGEVVPGTATQDGELKLESADGTLTSRVTPDAANFNVEGKLSGGALSGTIAPDAKKRVTFKAKLEIANVDLKLLATTLSQEPRITGRLDAKAIVTSTESATHTEATFTLREGTLNGFNVAQVMGHTSDPSATGGYVPFDRLAGRVTIERGAFRFNELQARYGALSARGDLTIGKGNVLSGRMVAIVPTPRGDMNVPVALGGTLEAPALRLTR